MIPYDKINSPHQNIVNKSSELMVSPPSAGVKGRFSPSICNNTFTIQIVQSPPISILTTPQTTSNSRYSSPQGVSPNVPSISPNFLTVPLNNKDAIAHFFSLAESNTKDKSSDDLTQRENKTKEFVGKLVSWLNESNPKNQCFEAVVVILDVFKQNLNNSPNLTNKLSLNDNQPQSFPISPTLTTAPLNEEDGQKLSLCNNLIQWVNEAPSEKKRFDAAEIILKMLQQDLKYISLDGLGLTTIPDKVIPLLNLKGLSLAHNRLDKFPSALLNQPWDELDLSDNQIALLPTLINPIKRFEAKNNKITYIPPEFIEKVRWLNMSHNNIKNIDAALLQKVQNKMTFYKVSFEPIFKLPKKPIFKLPQWTQSKHDLFLSYQSGLYYVNVTGNKLSNKTKIALKEITNIPYLLYDKPTNNSLFRNDDSQWKESPWISTHRLTQDASLPTEKDVLFSNKLLMWAEEAKSEEENRLGAVAIINEAFKQDLKYISLDNLGLTTIPLSIKSLNLKGLSLANNQLEEFPPVLLDQAWDELDLSNNNIALLPQISHPIKRFEAINNKITYIPSEFIEKVRWLNMSHNNIKNIDAALLQKVEYRQLLDEDLAITQKEFVFQLPQWKEKQDCNFRLDQSGLYYFNVENNKLSYSTQNALKKVTNINFLIYTNRPENSLLLK